MEIHLKPVEFINYLADLLVAQEYRQPKLNIREPLNYKD